MKKIITACLAIAMSAGMMAIAVSAAAPTAKSATTCQTKYPILLVHGAGFRDMEKSINYWGRIPAALEALGATIFYGGTDGWGGVEDNAKTLQRRVNEILAQTKAAKVNIIAHSKGGLDARYMISSLGMANKVASLTTISTPHRGSKTVEKVLKAPDWMMRIVAPVMNGISRLTGDANPDFYAGVHLLASAGMTEFNKANPNAKGVYYQSYAGAMSSPASSFLLFAFNPIVSKLEGENDGLVSVESAQWGNFKGVLRSATGRGVSHADEVDASRLNFTNKPSKPGISDIRAVYIGIVSELKGMGF